MASEAEIDNQAAEEKRQGSGSEDSESEPDELSEAVTSYHRIYQREAEVEIDEQQEQSDDEDLPEAYEGEPIADEQWLAEYRRNVAENVREMTELQRRFDAIEQVELW